MMSDAPFGSGRLYQADDLPDHYLQEIKDLTSAIIECAFFDSEKGVERDRNMSFGALQRALGLTIARSFKKDCVMDITRSVCSALMKSVEEWSNNDQ